MSKFFLFLFLAIICCNFLVAQEDNEPATITIDPLVAVNPVKTQHTFIATVLDRNGKPLGGQRVEWIIARDPYKGVGDIVDHDDKEAIVGSNKVVKLANNYTVSFTNERPQTLTMGTPHPGDDIELGVGQTWLTITSPIEGETHVIAFCPAIKNTFKHKEYAIKYWIDAKIDWPENAVNRVGEPHQFTFQLTKASTNAPMSNYQVKWVLVQESNSPQAYLGESSENYDTEKGISTLTDEEGKASVTLKQVDPVEGYNRVRIELRDPEGKTLASRIVTKQWIAPKLNIVKQGPLEGIIKEKLTYDLVVSNPGQAEASNVIVKDTLPDSFSYLSANPSPVSNDGKNLIWNLGNIAQGGNQRIQVSIRAEEVGLHINTATVDSDTTEPTQSSITTKITAPKLYIVKEGPIEVRKGQPARYIVTVKNSGDAIARQVFIRDFIPSGMRYKNIDTGTNLRWNIGDLPAKGEKRFEYTLDTPNTGSFINEAQVFMDGNEQSPVHQTAWTTKVVAPDLKLTKKGSSSLVILNRPSEYIITIVNDGDASAKDMVLVDILPKYMDFVSSNPRTTYRPPRGEELATLTWKLGDIQPKQTIEITIQVRANTSGRCTNVAKLRSDSPELPIIPPLEASYDTTIHGVPAMHINSYDTEDPVELGKQTIYVIEVRNEGTSSCTNVVMIDHLDDEMEFLSANGPSQYKVEGTKIIFEPVPILLPGDKLTYRITCKAVKEGSAKNTATLTYDQFTKPIIDEEGTSVYK